MTRAFSNHRILAVALLFALGISGYKLSAQDATQSEGTTSESIEAAFGPGPFDLLTPTVGLAELSSYRAALIVSFEGTNEGQSTQWSRTYTMTVTQTPSARQLTIEQSEDPTAQLFRAEVKGAFYERQEDDSCVASTVEPDGTFAQTWEPAGFLDSIIGADEAGADTINDIAVNHYTFDERAQGALNIAESTGELWIATDGGYVVRYSLTTTGGADYFGDGIEGTMRWDYQLADMNQPLVIEVPEDCPPGVLDVPILPDAANVLELPGVTTYDTSSDLDTVLAFYQDELSAAGGEPAYPPVTAEAMTLFGFTLHDQPILVIMNSENGNTRVQILGMDDAADLAFAAEVPDARGVEAAAQEGNTSEECEEAADIPMLPDASAVQNLPGVLSYTTSASVTDARTFYEEQISASGGQVSSPMPATNMMAMLEATRGNQVMVITIMALGGTSNVTITSSPSTIQCGL